MKIRNSFVSNSSSSSFIVGFSRYPKDYKDMAHILFGEDLKDVDGEEILYANPFYEDERTMKGWPVSVVANQVFVDLTGQDNSLTFKGAIALLRDICFAYAACPYDKVSDRKEYEDWYKNSDRKKKIEIEKHLVEFLEKASGLKRADWNGDMPSNMKFYHFHYSDHESEMEAAMESGELFDRVPKMRISLH